MAEEDEVDAGRVMITADVHVSATDDNSFLRGAWSDATGYIDNIQFA